MLINNGIEYMTRTDLNMMNNYIETVFVEINKVIFNSTTNIVYTHTSKCRYKSVIVAILKLYHKSIFNYDKHLLTSDL